MSEDAKMKARVAKSFKKSKGYPTQLGRSMLDKEKAPRGRIVQQRGSEMPRKTKKMRTTQPMAEKRRKRKVPKGGLGTGMAERAAEAIRRRRRRLQDI